MGILVLRFICRGVGIAVVFIMGVVIVPMGLLLLAGFVQQCVLPIPPARQPAPVPIPTFPTLAQLRALKLLLLRRLNALFTLFRLMFNP